MTMLYPNDLDVYGFCPTEAEAERGDLVVDRNTGVMGRITYKGALKGVYAGGVFWELKEDQKEAKE